LFFDKLYLGETVTMTNCYAEQVFVHTQVITMGIKPMIVGSAYAWGAYANVDYSKVYFDPVSLPKKLY
jgi:hypothetical protein